MKQELRTPLARAMGLGSAKEGVQHWWAQRVSAVALVLLGLWFVASLIALAGADHLRVVAWLHGPLAAVLTILMLAAVFYHTALGLQVVIEDYVHTVPHGDRSGAVIEPYLTDQWYVDAATLAKPAIEAVKRGRTTFVPKNWESTYFHWMENIQPWCISRQLW